MTNLPPILIYHGDKDTLVPLEQSERFQNVARAFGGKVEVRVCDIRKFGDWFDQYLRGENQ